MYKAVFTDMDGTLLRKDHTVSAYSKKMIHRLTDKGILVVPISARPLHGMLHITEHVFTPEVPVISLNGSYIYHNGTIIHEISMPLPEVEQINTIAAGYPVSMMYYHGMNWYAAAATPAIKKEQKITPVQVSLQPFESVFAAWKEQQTGPNKILLAGDEKIILEVETKLLQQLDQQLNIYKSQPRYVEAMHLQASKINAIKMIMDMYGLKQEEIIAIGDNYNDVGMIEFAGLGIAMGNAPQDIKAKAAHVTDTNNHDGVAKALEYFFGT